MARQWLGRCRTRAMAAHGSQSPLSPRRSWPPPSRPHIAACCPVSTAASMLSGYLPRCAQTRGRAE
eukprot:14283558-Alexandrium_andersonii.AAC.1